VHLDLGANMLNSSAVLKIFDAIRQNDSIYCLMFSNSSGPHQNHIKSDAFVHASQALLNNKTLGILNMSGNMLGNEGLKYFVKGFSGNKVLQLLNISQTYIDNLSISYVATILKNSRITHLDISKNKLGNEVFFS